jgi:uncharacterized protein YndB with AHSA1/START domain
MIPFSSDVREDGNVVHVFSTDGKEKEVDERQPGDILVVEYPRLLAFYDVTDTSVEYVTAMSKAKILPLLR